MKRSNTVLIIEEDASIRFMMREIARALDIKVETAVSSGEGLSWLRARPWHFAMLLLNLDIRQNGDDDTVERIRDDQQAGVREIPIIGMMEKCQGPDSTAFTQLRVDSCLRKPVTPAELLALTDRYTSPLATFGP